MKNCFNIFNAKETTEWTVFVVVAAVVIVVVAAVVVELKLHSLPRDKTVACEKSYRLIKV